MSNITYMDGKVQQIKKIQNQISNNSDFKEQSLKGSNSTSHQNNKGNIEERIVNNTEDIYQMSKQIQNNTNEYNIATFTFGGKTSNTLKDNLLKKQIHNQNHNNNNNLQQNVHNLQNQNYSSENKNNDLDNQYLDNKNRFGGSYKDKIDKFSYSGFISTKVKSCTYISSVLQLIFNMKYLRDHIQHELIFDDKKFILLTYVKVRIFYLENF